MKYWTYTHHYTVDIQVSELQFDNFAKPTSCHRTKISFMRQTFFHPQTSMQKPADCGT